MTTLNRFMIYALCPRIVTLVLKCSLVHTLQSNTWANGHCTMFICAVQHSICTLYKYVLHKKVKMVLKVVLFTNRYVTYVII